MKLGDIISAAITARNEWPGDAEVLGKSPIELFSGRAPAWITTPDMMTPAAISAKFNGTNDSTDRIHIYEKLKDKAIQEIPKLRADKQILEALEKQQREQNNKYYIDQEIYFLQMQINQREKKRLAGEDQH